MKRKMLTVLSLVLLLCLVAAFTFAGGTKEATGKAKGRAYQIIYVAKLVGIPWYNAVKDGMAVAGKDLGVTTDLVGPAQPDAAQQAQIVEDLIAKGVDALLVMPNDTKMFDPVLQKARDKGILVLTNESKAQQTCNYDVEMLDDQAYGQAWIDELVKAAGENGDYAVFVGGLTVAAHMMWMDYAVDYQKKHYPGWHQVGDRFPVSESVEQSHDKALELIKTYPNLKGFISIGSLAPTGIANALREKGLIGKIANVGSTLPSMLSPILKDGSASAGICYSPRDLGIVDVYLAKWLLDGNKIEDFKGVPGVAGGKPPKINGKLVVFDALLHITKENVDSFGF